MSTMVESKEQTLHTGQLLAFSSPSQLVVGIPRAEVDLSFLSRCPGGQALRRRIQSAFRLVCRHVHPCKRLIRDKRQGRVGGHWN
jgi:hypothetical protein